MQASASIQVERRHGRDEVVERRAGAPLAIRRCAETVMIASTAATPVGGDELNVDVVVGPGARARIGSVAAMLTWPGPDGEASVMRTTCDVGPGAHLQLTPEPTVSVAGSRHRSITRVRLCAGATCAVVEELALGRVGEASGDIGLSLRIERDGHPLFHHDEWFGPDAPATTTSVSIGAARHVVTAVIVGTWAGPSRTLIDGHRAGSRMPIADDAIAVLAIGDDRPAVLELIAGLAPELWNGYGKTIRPLEKVDQR